MTGRGRETAGNVGRKLAVGGNGSGSVFISLLALLSRSQAGCSRECKKRTVRDDHTLLLLDLMGHGSFKSVFI